MTRSDDWCIYHEVEREAAHAYYDEAEADPTDRPTAQELAEDERDYQRWLAARGDT